MPEYSIDIQQTEEYTYHVKARSRRDAEKKAWELHMTGDDNHVHSEVVNGPYVTNAEKM